MNLHLQNKSVLVLASSQGIGRGIATAFAAEGARVMLFGRQEDSLVTVRDALRAAGGTAEYHVGDVTRAEDLAAAAAAADTAHGPVYTLVNNSGGPPPGGFDAFDDDAWHKACDLTLLSYVRAIRNVLPQMRSQDGGRILNIASSSTKAAIDNLLLSNVFRTAVLGLNKSLAREFGGSGILVNTLSPGKIATARVETTDASKAVKLGVSKEDLQAKQRGEIPLGRYGGVEELAQLALFLGSPANTYVTGQNVMVDGGWSAAY